VRNIKILIKKCRCFTKNFIPRRSIKICAHRQETCQRAAEKIGGMEFYDVHFSYIDNETLNEEFVSVPEQGGGKNNP
jgi:ATP-dependent Lon protease